MQVKCQVKEFHFENLCRVLSLSLRRLKTTCPMLSNKGSVNSRFDWDYFEELGIFSQRRSGQLTHVQRICDPAGYISMCGDAITTSAYATLKTMWNCTTNGSMKHVGDLSLLLYAITLRSVSCRKQSQVNCSVAVVVNKINAYISTCFCYRFVQKKSLNINRLLGAGGVFAC